MKANRKIRKNKKGVAPALTLLLVLPIILAIITAISFWSQNIIISMDDLQDKLHDIRDDLGNLDYASLVNSSQIIYIDDFEDVERNQPQWNVHCNSGASFNVGPKTRANYSYYTGHLGGHFDLKSFPNNFCRISKAFTDKCMGNVSIEIAFTIGPYDEYKVFSIYQNDDQNNGSIKIDVVNNRVYFNETNLIDDNLVLYANHLCWHTMKLIVNFDSDDSNPYSLHFINFTLDGRTYDLTSKPLCNPDFDVSQDPNSINVAYTCVSNGNSESWVDDFVFRNLEPYKDMKIVWV